MCLVLQVRCCVCAIREELGGEFEQVGGKLLQGDACRWSPCLDVPQFFGVSRMVESPLTPETALADRVRSPGGGRRICLPPGPEVDDGKERGQASGGAGRGIGGGGEGGEGGARGAGGARGCRKAKVGKTS